MIVYDKLRAMVLYRGHTLPTKGHELPTMVILPSTLGAMCPPSSSIRRLYNEKNIYNVVYTAELLNHRVSVFTCEGKFLTSFGSYGSGPGQFSGPRGIAVDKNGVVYVSDTGNNRLQLF